MSAYRSLTLQYFRSYTDFSVSFGPGVNIIVGPNGSGKTNLLEALYVLSTGSSFRGSDRDLVQWTQPWFRLQGIWGDQTRVLTYRRVADTTEKQFSLDGAKKARLTHAQRVPVVLFEPDHLRLLRESPNQRRDHMDDMLGKLQPDFSWLKHQFERVLLQRNNILKRRLSLGQLEDQLFAWDIKFAELGQQLVRRRQQLIAAISARLGGLYGHIAQTQQPVTIAYQSSVPLETYQASLLKALHQALAHDVERGFTTLGPHRDDFMINLNKAPAATSASRGEMRSLLLALKIIEAQLLSEQSGSTPLLLLDDVFSELDAARRRALADLAKTYQTLITTTDAEAVTAHFSDSYISILTG